VREAHEGLWACQRYQLQAFRDGANDPKNGLPVFERTLLHSDMGNKDRDKARDMSHYLLLDSLKKGREIETKEALATTKRNRDSAAMTPIGMLQVA